jgi:hypothetical protein
VVGQLGSGDREGGLERRGREIGQGRTHGAEDGQRLVGDEVRRRDAQQTTAVGPAHRVHGCRPVPGRDRDVGERVGADRLEQLRTDRTHVDADGRAHVGHDVEEVVMTDEVVTERGRRAEDGDETAAHGGVDRVVRVRVCILREEPPQRGRPSGRRRGAVGAERRAQADEREQREVRVRSLAQAGQELALGRDRPHHGEAGQPTGQRGRP